MNEGESRSPREPWVVWSSALFNQSGYAEEARAAVLALDRAGIPVAANPTYWVPWQKQLPEMVARRLEELVAIEVPERYVHVMHMLPHHYVRAPGAVRHIGRTMWETETLPPGWADICNSLDEVWVPGDFNLETFARAGVDPRRLRKVPECLHLEWYDPPAEPLELPGVSGFVFLAVFAWSLRKGWDVLVRAYLEEFAAEDDVTLAMVVRPFASPVRERLAELDHFVRHELRRDPMRSARIIVMESSPDMPRLYRSVDAYVLPSRGEGWGRPYMEAMASGLPVIASRWSGNLEFMNDQNAYLIDCQPADVSPEAAREWPWFAGQRWAEPSVEHLRALLRRVRSRPEEARAKGERARRDIFASYGLDRVGQLMADLLRDFEPPKALPQRRSRRPHTRPRYGPGQAEAALSELEQAARAAPEDSGAAYRLAVAYLAVGRTEEGKEELLRALERTEARGEDSGAHMADAYLLLASLGLEEDRLIWAAHRARDAVELDPGLGAAFTVLADAVEAMGLQVAARQARIRAAAVAQHEAGC